MDWLYQFDMNAFRAINVGMHSSTLDPFFEVLSYSGLGVSLTLFALFLAAFKSTRSFVLPLLVTLFVSGVVFADGVKSLVTRDRPSNLKFAIRQEDWLHTSFPSGHSSVSFGLATMLLLLTWRTKYRWVGPVALGWATFVGISRIYRGVHWPTDVIAGACFGIASACIVFLFLNPKKKQSAPE